MNTARTSLSLVEQLELCRDEQQDLARAHHARYWVQVLAGLAAVLTPVAIGLVRGFAVPTITAVAVIVSGVVTLALSIPFFNGRSQLRKATNDLETSIAVLREDAAAAVSDKIMALCKSHIFGTKERKHRREPCDGDPVVTFEKIKYMRDAGRRRHLAYLTVVLLLCVFGVTFATIWWLFHEELNPTAAPMTAPILFAVGAALGIGFALVVTFRMIKLEHAQVSYRTCDGCWYEARLNDCEQGLTSLPQQPVNTYTNLAYLMVGVFVAAYFATPSSFAFMIAMTFLAIGSSLYHGLSSRWSGHFDVAAIYWVFGGLLLQSFGRLVGLVDTPITILMVFGSGIGAAFLRLVLPKRMIPKIAGLLVFTYGFKVWHSWASGLTAILILIASLLLFLIAYLIWILDKKQLFLFRRVGHGLWHTFTAVSIGLLYYVSAVY
jgi:hypothetical protein